MKLIRTCMFALAVLLPTSWTLAHAADEGGGDKSGGEMKKEGKKKSKKEKKGEKGEGGDMGKGDMDKK